MFKVLDHGRIVDSVHNGRYFCMMIMDLKSLQRHYGDCLELGGEVEKDCAIAVNTQKKFVKIILYELFVF